MKESIMKKPFVTIGIPVFNGQDDILLSVQSCIRQNCDFEYEILVVNDGSTDDTSEVLSSIKSDKLRVINFKKNQGIATTMNNIIKNAKGEYICFLDADDIMLHSRIQSQLDKLKEAEACNPKKMVMNFCDSFVYRTVEKKGKKQIKPYIIDSKTLFYKFGGGTGHSMYRKQDLINLGYFNTNSNRAADKIMIFLFLLHGGIVTHCNAPHIVYNFFLDEANSDIEIQDDKVFSQVLNSNFNIFLKNKKNNLYSRDSLMALERLSRRKFSPFGRAIIKIKYKLFNIFQ